MSLPLRPVQDDFAVVHDQKRVVNDADIFQRITFDYQYVGIKTDGDSPGMIVLLSEARLPKMWLL